MEIFTCCFKISPLAKKEVGKILLVFYTQLVTKYTISQIVKMCQSHLNNKQIAIHRWKMHEMHRSPV